jgi:hypothetical protein
MTCSINSTNFFLEIEQSINHPVIIGIVVLVIIVIMCMGPSKSINLWA